MRRFAASILMAIWVGSATSLSAQTQHAARIEENLKIALNAPEGATTQGMVDAYDVAVKGYASEIARIYKKLHNGLPINQRKAIDRSQKAWLPYLDSYRETVSYIYDAPGTMHRVTAMGALKTMLEHRLQELCEFFQNDSKDFSEIVPEGEFWCADAHDHLPGPDPLGDLQGVVKPKGHRNKK